MEYAHENKYLGFLFNKFLYLAIENSTHVQRVFESGNQALGALIATTKESGGLAFQCLPSHIMLQ